MNKHRYFLVLRIEIEECVPLGSMDRAIKAVVKDSTAREALELAITEAFMPETIGEVSLELLA